MRSQTTKQKRKKNPSGLAMCTPEKKNTLAKRAARLARSVAMKKVWQKKKALEEKMKLESANENGNRDQGIEVVEVDSSEDETNNEGETTSKNRGNKKTVKRSKKVPKEKNKVKKNPGGD